MPFAQDELSWGLACGIGPDDHWHGRFDVRVRADALRRLGLHPDQPTAEVLGVSPPGWWHAAAERRAMNWPHGAGSSEPSRDGL